MRRLPRAESTPFWLATLQAEGSEPPPIRRVRASRVQGRALKSASKTHAERLVRPSKIFVWGCIKFTRSFHRHLNDDLICDDMTMCQSRPQA